jgi:hypothetical protein
MTIDSLARVALYFALPVLLLVFALLARVWEKRLVWPYASGDEPPRTSRMSTSAGDAETLGFRRVSVGRDAKGRIYRIRYEFWLPPEHDSLLLIGGGSLAGMPVDGSWLFTRLSNGRCLVSVDDLRGSEYDLTGLSEEAIYPGVPLRVLLDRHRARIAAAAAPPLPYGERDPASDHRAFLTQRIQSLVQAGFATWHDPSQDAWRYTAKGALQGTIRSYATGLLAALRSPLRVLRGGH